MSARVELLGDALVTPAGQRYRADRQTSFPRMSLDPAPHEGAVVALADGDAYVAGASIVLMPHALAMDDLAGRWAPLPGSAVLDRPTARIHRLWTRGGAGQLRRLFLSLAAVFPARATAICGVCAVPPGYDALPEHLGLVAPRAVQAELSSEEPRISTSDGVRVLGSYLRWGARPLGPNAVDAEGAQRALLWADLSAIPAWLRPGPG